MPSLNPKMLESLQKLVSEPKDLQLTPTVLLTAVLRLAKPRGREGQGSVAAGSQEKIIA